MSFLWGFLPSVFLQSVEWNLRLLSLVFLWGIEGLELQEFHIRNRGRIPETVFEWIRTGIFEPVAGEILRPVRSK